MQMSEMTAREYLEGHGDNRETIHFIETCSCAQLEEWARATIHAVARGEGISITDSVETFIAIARELYGVSDKPRKAMYAEAARELGSTADRVREVAEADWDIEEREHRAWLDQCAQGIGGHTRREFRDWVGTALEA